MKSIPRRFIICCLLLSWGFLLADEEPLYKYVSRESTAVIGEATSTNHLRQFVSREVTVGMGEATSTAHVRNFVSREYTAGIGSETMQILPVLPENACLAGTVELSLDAQFIRNPKQMTFSWSLKHNGAILASGMNADWENFSYRWDTRTVENGAYDMEMRFIRPNQDDVVISRRYYVLNIFSDGENIVYALRPGWNLISVPFEIELAGGGKALLSMLPVVYERLQRTYVGVTESMKAGTAAWLFSRETQTIQIWTEKGVSNEPELPPGLVKGWNLTGICGAKELLLDCEAEGVSAIWKWNGRAFTAVPVENGAAVLEPDVGYWLYLDK